MKILLHNTTPLILLLLLALLLLCHSDSDHPCRDQCGTIPIHYPFAIDDGCGAPQFRHMFTCNTTSSSLFFITPNGNYKVQSIDYKAQTMTVYDPDMSTCTILQPHHNIILTDIQYAIIPPSPDTIFALLNCSVDSPILHRFRNLCFDLPGHKCEDLYSSCSSFRVFTTSNNGPSYGPGQTGPGPSGSYYGSHLVDDTPATSNNNLPAYNNNPPSSYYGSTNTPPGVSNNNLPGYSNNPPGSYYGSSTTPPGASNNLPGNNNNNGPSGGYYGGGTTSPSGGYYGGGTTSPSGGYYGGGTTSPSGGYYGGGGGGTTTPGVSNNLPGSNNNGPSGGYGGGDGGNNYSSTTPGVSNNFPGSNNYGQGSPSPPCCFTGYSTVKVMSMDILDCTHFTSFYNVDKLRGVSPMDWSYGLKFSYSVPDMGCERCVKSGGSCGFDAETETLLCLCSGSNNSTRQCGNDADASEYRTPSTIIEAFFIGLALLFLVPDHIHAYY